MGSEVKPAGRTASEWLWLRRSDQRRGRADIRRPERLGDGLRTIAQGLKAPNFVVLT